MNKNLIGKRLLVLGGSIWKEAIKEYAVQNGIVLVSAGLYPAGTDDIAKEIYRIDTTDADLMKPFIKDHQIDGVYDSRRCLNHYLSAEKREGEAENRG